MNKNKIKKICNLSLPVVIAIISFLMPLFFRKFIKFDDSNVATLIVSILFTMFGFLITAMTIVIGFMKENDAIARVMKQGHFWKFIISVIILFVISVFSLVIVIFEANYLFLVMAICSGIAVVFYITVVLLFLCYQYLRLKEINK